MRSLQVGIRTGSRTIWTAKTNVFGRFEAGLVYGEVTDGMVPTVCGLNKPGSDRPISAALVSLIKLQAQTQDSKAGGGAHLHGRFLPSSKTFAEAGYDMKQSDAKRRFFCGNRGRERQPKPDMETRYTDNWVGLPYLLRE